jgi:fructokinase
MREVPVHGFPTVSGIVVLDLQGFVRDPSVPTGRSSSRFDLVPLLVRADYVKATEDEIARLTPESQAALTETVVLRTHGRHGTFVSQGGTVTPIPAHVVETHNTIGAGDTFLAAFVSGLLAGTDAVGSATTAARRTEAFLRERK